MISLFTGKGKYSTIIGIVFLVVIIVGLFFALKDEGDKYIARVGDSIVESYEFDFFLSMEKTYLEQLAGVYDNEELRQEFWNSKMSGEDPLNIAKERALDAIREYKIYGIKAREYNVKLDDKQESRIQKSVEEKKSKLKNADFGIMKTKSRNTDNDVFLDEYGINVEEYKKIIKEMELIRKFEIFLDDMEKAQKDALLKKWSEDPKYELVVNMQMID